MLVSAAFTLLALVLQNCFGSKMLFMNAAIGLVSIISLVVYFFSIVAAYYGYDLNP